MRFMNPLPPGVAGDQLPPASFVTRASRFGDETTQNVSLGHAMPVPGSRAAEFVDVHEAPPSWLTRSTAAFSPPTVKHRPTVGQAIGPGRALTAVAGLAPLRPASALRRTVPWSPTA